MPASSSASPRHLQRVVVTRRLRVLVACLGVAAAPTLAACNCSKAAPEPEAKRADAAGRPAAAPGGSGAAQLVTFGPDGAVTTRTLPHDRLGNPIASAEPDAATGEAPPPREPDWDLDLEDGARDYVIRYIRATRRYDDKTACVAVDKSTDAGTRKRVAVRDDPKSPCGGTSTQERDVFLVDAPGDRLALEDSKKQAALKKWPDGSDPEAPPSPLQSVDDFKKWRTPLYEAFVQLKLVPMRLQFYGRGTYQVFTLAGWHEGALERHQPPDKLGALAEKLCAANDKSPLGIFAGLNRVDFLRVRCPGVGPATAKPTVKWEKM